MATREDWIRQLYENLSNINHPVEGMFYLLVLAVIVRWIWPRPWNNFLIRISAKMEGENIILDEQISKKKSRNNDQ